ncbi:MAG: hypothetical protein WEB50_09700 [Vicinamibacterales bacterium]
MLDRKHGIVRRQSPEVTAAERELYTLEDDCGERDRRVESALADLVDGPGQHAIRVGDDGRANFYHSIAYAFHLADGREVRGATGSQDGRLPPELVNSPQTSKVDVEYLAEEPTVNRLKGYGSSSFADWLFRKILLGGFLFALLVLPGLKIFRDGIAEFRSGQYSGGPLTIERVDHE